MKENEKEGRGKKEKINQQNKPKQTKSSYPQNSGVGTGVGSLVGSSVGRAVGTRLG